MNVEKLAYDKSVNPGIRYMNSKAGDYYYATEYAKRHREEGLVSVVVNPGLLDSELWRESSSVVRTFVRTFFLYKPVYGAYTELYGGLAAELNDKSGSWSKFRLFLVAMTMFGPLLR